MNCIGVSKHPIIQSPRKYWLLLVFMHFRLVSAQTSFRAFNNLSFQFQGRKKVHLALRAEYKTMSEQVVGALYESKSMPSSPSPYLKPYKLYSWKPDKCRSIDENYMDLCMILTRSVQYRQGSMGCIIVNPTIMQSDSGKDGNTEFNESKFYDAIIGSSTNQSLFNPMDSDIHAEIATLGQCSQNGNSTKKCTVYITMPPCKRCFGALVAAGIQRIVSNKEYAKAIADGARGRNIELVTMSKTFSEEQRERISQLMSVAISGDNAHRVAEERNRRKEEKKRRKEQRILLAEENAMKHQKTK